METIPGKIYDHETGNEAPLSSTGPGPDLGTTLGGPKGFRYFLDNLRRVWVNLAMITSPGAAPQVAQVSTGTEYLNPPPALWVNSRLYIHGAGPVFDNLRIWESIAASNGAQVYLPDKAAAVGALEQLYQVPGNMTSLSRAMAYQFVNFSGVNASQTFTFDTLNLCHLFSLYMLCAPAGTATIQTEVATDGANYFVCESRAAAASFAIIFDDDHPASGAGSVAINPLAFRYIRVTCGAPGAGNLTKLWVAIK